MNNVNSYGHSLRSVEIRKDYKKEKSSDFTNFPSSFDCPYISPVKEDPWLTDWLFAGTTLLESYLLAHENMQSTDADLSCSEHHGLHALYEIDKQTHENKWGLNPNEFGYFGNRQYMLAYFTRGDGAVPTLADTNQSVIVSRSRATTDSKPQRYIIREALFIPNPYIFPDPLHQFTIKNSMLSTGVHATLMYYDIDYLKESNGEYCYYCPVLQNEPSAELQELIYHSVIIIGWDDNFDKNRFKTSPKNNGAFKVRDCNGAARNGKAYFWVSYEDVEFGHDTWAIKNACKDFFEKLHTIYQHDLFGFGAAYPEGKKLTGEISGKNIFKRDKTKNGEKVEAIGFYVVAPCKCNFYMKQKGEAEKKLNRTDDIFYTNPGYYQYILPNKQPLTEEELEIRIEFKSPDGHSAVFVPLEKNDKRTVHLTLKAGESFIENEDVTTINTSFNLNLGHVCIKAIVTDESVEAQKINDAYSNTVFPANSRGILPHLPFTLNEVTLDWTQQEPGSEGEAGSFLYRKTATTGIWVNNTNNSKRIVVTVTLNLANRKLKKLLWTQVGKKELWPATASKVESGQVNCSIDGSFLIDGVRVKVKAWNKTSSTQPIIYGDPAKYPTVKNGSWKNENFNLLAPKNYDENHKVYCIQADFLDLNNEVICSSVISEATVEKLCDKKGNSVIAWTVAGIVAGATMLITGGVIFFKNSIICGGVADGAAVAAGYTLLENLDENIFLDGKGNTIETGENFNQTPAIRQTSGTIRNIRWKAKLVGGTLAAAGIVTLIVSLTKGSLVQKCTFDITIDNSANPNSILAGIAENCEGTIEDCTVNIHSSRKITEIAGITLKNKKGGIIRNCTIKGDINSKTASGVATINNGDISNCNVTASLSADTIAGGLCSESDEGILSANSFTGTISGKVGGGIIGRLKGGEVKECVSSVDLKDIQEAGGGIIGKQEGGSIHDCYSTGIITGQGCLGGINGTMAAGTTAERCYSLISINTNAVPAGIASGIAGTSTDGSIKNCMAVNTYLAGSEIYRITKNKPGNGCKAIEEIQTVTGKSFPDTGEELKPVTALCHPDAFRSMGWDLTTIWKMNNTGQFPELVKITTNPPVRHPFIVIQNQPIEEIYKFAYGNEVKFSGLKNPLIKRIEWELSGAGNTVSTTPSSATEFPEIPVKNNLPGLQTAQDENNWAETIGTLEKGKYLLTLYAIGEAIRIPFILNIVVE